MLIMGRPNRIHRPGRLYHVMLRGNQGQTIFLSNKDREKMWYLLKDGATRFNFCLHAYCFMSNHIHLAIEVNEISISTIMQNIAFRYVQYFNKMQKIHGHLFQDRFKSIIIEGGRYFRELIRYIHLNPVRAGLVSDPINYPWSSHSLYLQSENMWITREKMLKDFGNDYTEKIYNYNSYILEGVDKKQEVNFQIGNKGIIGSDEFIKEMLMLNENQNEFINESINVIRDMNGNENAFTPKIQLSELIAGMCARYQVTLMQVCQPNKERKISHIRALLALLVRRSEHLSLEALSSLIHREASGLSRLAIRLESECKKDEVLAEEIVILEEWMSNYKADDKVSS